MAIIPNSTETKCQAEDVGHFSPPLDEGIAAFVMILSRAGVETYESCAGGVGHPCPEPMIRFHGNRGAGFNAVSVALDNALPIAELRRFWSIQEGELTGPSWEMTFYRKAP